MDWTITKKNTKIAFIAIVSILFTNQVQSIFIGWFVLCSAWQDLDSPGRQTCKHTWAGFFGLSEPMGLQGIALAELNEMGRDAPFTGNTTGAGSSHLGH